MKKRTRLIFSVIALIAALILCSTIANAESGLTSERKDNFEDIASSVLNKHYGTDDIWKIILGQSVVIWIHENDLHAGKEGSCSGRDLTLTNAVMQKVIKEH